MLSLLQRMQPRSLRSGLAARCVKKYAHTHILYIYIYTVYTYLPVATDNLKVAVVNHVFGILFV